MTRLAGKIVAITDPPLPVAHLRREVRRGFKEELGARRLTGRADRTMVLASTIAVLHSGLVVVLLVLSKRADAERGAQLEASARASLEATPSLG